MNKGDRIIFTRTFHKDKRLISTGGEFIRHVRGGKKAVIVLDDKFYETTAPIGQLTLGDR